jgi:hypothetical protein
MIDASNVVVTQISPDIGQQPLSPVGALAALLAATSVLTVTDAANAVGLSPESLVAEVQAWAVAGEQ